jgi:hypothetical protein
MNSFAGDGVKVPEAGRQGLKGAGGTVVGPDKGRKLTKQQEAHNRMVNSVRGVVRWPSGECAQTWDQPRRVNSLYDPNDVTPITWSHGGSGSRE